MTYQDAVSWMLDRLPSFQNRGNSALNLKSDSFSDFLDHLGNPHHNFKSIHIAGTNGKGSASHMLASIFQENGCKVGLYTSPHLLDFRERIKINGECIHKDFVVDFIKIHRDYIQSRKMSFFELTVGMAFYYLSESKVDIAIVETGLGGRLDSTNVIRPEVCLITNVGYDHMDILGKTLLEISREKAGIIKNNTPVVISEYQPETIEVFKKIARQRKAPITIASEKNYKNYQTDLLGWYQKKNIKGVLAVIEVDPQWQIRQKTIEKGLKNVVKNTGLLGRWQCICQSPKVIADTAHNPPAFEEILPQLEALKASCYHFVLGFSKDKNIENILSKLPKKARYYFCKSSVLKGLDADKLQSTATFYKLHGKTFSDVAKAYKCALKTATSSDVIYVGGSSFIVADLLSYLKN